MKSGEKLQGLSRLVNQSPFPSRGQEEEAEGCTIPGNKLKRVAAERYGHRSRVQAQGKNCLVAHRRPVRQKKLSASSGPKSITIGTASWSEKKINRISAGIVGKIARLLVALYDPSTTGEEAFEEDQLLEVHPT